MSDNPKISDKYPSLVLQGYIDSVKGDTLTSPPSLESVTQRLLRLKKLTCEPQGANTIVTGRYIPLDFHTFASTAPAQHKCASLLFLFIVCELIPFIIRQHRMVYRSSTLYGLSFLNIVLFIVDAECCVFCIYRFLLFVHLLDFETCNITPLFTNGDPTFSAVFANMLYFSASYSLLLIYKIWIYLKSSYARVPGNNIVHFRLYIIEVILFYNCIQVLN